MNNTKLLVLQSFKKLHRVRMKVFDGDEKALAAARIKINEEYSKNKHVKNADTVMTMIKLADDVATELKTQVIQAKQIKPGVYKARLTEDILKLDNVPYNEKAVEEKIRQKSSKDQKNPCCSNTK
ncbi:hypothetical protein ACJJTC_009033 [Scirpophaga incertulas]